MKINIPKDLIAKIAVGSLLAIGVLGIGAQVTAEFMGDSLDTMEQSYKLEVDNIAASKAQTQKLIEANCLTEIAMAKRKLEKHYSNEQLIPKEEIQAKVDKAEGKNLRCRTF